MGKTSFQNLQKLVREIDAKITALKSANLSVNELDELVKMSADLHERLAVIRFKAYEAYGEPEVAFDISFSEESSSQETPKNTVHAEAPKTFEEPKKETAPLEEESITFDVPKMDEPITPELEKPVEQPKETAKKVKKESVVAEKETKKPIHVLREEVKPDSTALHEKFLKEDEVALNEALKKEEEDLPLRKKLSQKPIKDLRTEIGIGKKFEYINFLFAGDAKAYETAITELNNCGSAENAKMKLNVYASVYRWNLEEKTIVKFVELVERRFL